MFLLRRDSCLNLFGLVLAILMMPFGGLQGEDSAKENPFRQLWDAVKKTDSLESELSGERLSQIIPADCEINGIKFTKEEMEFLLVTWKLNFATSDNNIDKSGMYLDQLEMMLAKGSINLDAVSVKSREATGDINQDIKKMTMYDRMAAYVLTGKVTDKQISEIQEIINEVEKGSPDYFKNKYLLGIAYIKLQRQQLAIDCLEQCFEYFIEEKQYKSYAIDCAMRLRKLLIKDNPKEAEKYEKRVKELKPGIDEDQDFLRLISMMLDESSFDQNKKNRFLELKKKILKTDSNELLFKTYVTSASIERDHSDFFTDDDILFDLEKALQYYNLIDNGNNIDKELLSIFQEYLIKLKKEMLRKLELSKQYGKLDLWTAKFQSNDQTDSFLNASRIDYGVSSIASNLSIYDHVDRIIQSEEAKTPEKREKKLLLDAQKTKQELERSFDEIRKSLSVKDTEKFDQAMVDPLIIPPGFMRQLNSILPPDTACIQYLLLSDSIVTCITLRDTPPLASIMSLNSLGETSKSFKTRLIRIHTYLQDPNKEETTKKEMQWLYTILFSNIEKSLSGKKIRKLVINSSGLLRDIPLAALYNNGHYLIETYQVSSITGWDIIRIAKDAPQKQMNDLSIAIFADPDDSLSSARKEGEKIANLFAKKDVYIGEDATVDNFKTLAGKCSFVHLAMHAVPDSQNASKSYMLFANKEKLYCSDMMGFNIKNVDIISLSACSTALTTGSTDGEVHGIADSFLRNSPSGSILASLWDVDDSATSMLMCEFYKTISENVKKKHTLDRGGALREAQLSLLGKKETSAPRYWAAFTLFGDFR